MKISALGINRGKIKLFNEKGIDTIEDLVRLFPTKYYDFRKITPIGAVQDGEHCAVIGKITEMSKHEKLLKVTIVDEKNLRMNLIWFHQEYLYDLLKKEVWYCFCGKIEINNIYRSKSMINPMYYGTNIKELQKIIPVYPKWSGFSRQYLKQSIDNAILIVDKSEPYSEDTRKKFGLMTKAEAIRAIHQPNTMEEIEKAKKRFLFDDLYELANIIQNNKVDKQTSIRMTQANTIKKFLDALPYQLTEDQLRISRSIFRKFLSGERVSALVQGDVGCGKTVVAFILMLIAAENHYQSVLMAPTNVLAKQHYLELQKIGETFGYTVGFLSGELKERERKQTLKDIKEGSIHMIVGTHAILSEGVDFYNLGLHIVDEEHRFGVVQREAVSQRFFDIHRVTMSATPIPRSLALVLYGDGTDVYNINQMPQGRKQVITKMEANFEKACDFISNEVCDGHQGYVVCPLIDKSEADVMQGVLSVQETYQKMSVYFAGKNVKMAMMNGDMKDVDIANTLDRFVKKEIDVLVSTTIIEVGVNVPNATVIMVQNAERFGLSQLHQLRGRVGRGIHQSYCLLVTEKKEDARLETLIRTTDGFEIAKADLNLRGAGDFLGTIQSGENKSVMSMLANPSLFEQIKKELS